MMGTPGDLDAMLRGILKGDAKRLNIAAEDIAFINKMLDSARDGSQGVFAMLHDDGDGYRLQYMVVNGSESNAVAILARVLQRVAERAADKSGQ